MWRDSREAALPTRGRQVEAAGRAQATAASSRLRFGLLNDGGRVTDENDRRLLLALLSDFVAPGVLDERHVFCDGAIRRTRRRPPLPTSSTPAALSRNCPRTQRRLRRYG
jgi:hypothetical protein